MQVLKKVTPPFEEFGEMSGISISKTTTAKSWKGTRKSKSRKPEMRLKEKSKQHLHI